MALTGGVFHEVNTSRPKRDLFATGNFDFAVAAQGDYVLSTRSTMPVIDASAASAMELRAGDLHQPCDLRGVAGRELKLDLFGMSLVILTRVEVRDHYRFLRLCQNHARFGKPS